MMVLFVFLFNLGCLQRTGCQLPLLCILQKQTTQYLPEIYHVLSAKVSKVKVAQLVKLPAFGFGSGHDRS